MAGQPHAVHLEHQRPRRAQAFVDPVAAIQSRVVDESFPACDRTRLFEVHTHDHVEPVADALGDGTKAHGVLRRRVNVMD